MSANSQQSLLYCLSHSSCRIAHREGRLRRWPTSRRIASRPHGFPGLRGTYPDSSTATDRTHAHSRRRWRSHVPAILGSMTMCRAGPSDAWRPSERQCSARSHSCSGPTRSETVAKHRRRVRVLRSPYPAHRAVRQDCSGLFPNGTTLTSHFSPGTAQ